MEHKRKERDARLHQVVCLAVGVFVAFSEHPSAHADTLTLEEALLNGGSAQTGELNDLFSNIPFLTLTPVVNEAPSNDPPAQPSATASPADILQSFGDDSTAPVDEGLLAQLGGQVPSSQVPTDVVEGDMPATEQPAADEPGQPTNEGDSSADAGSSGEGLPGGSIADVLELTPVEDITAFLPGITGGQSSGNADVSLINDLLSSNGSSPPPSGAIPEPMTAALLLGGLVGGLGARARQRK
ncbi:MAG: PEP-CTERM sorting domain-containing protein [Bdellovibrionales bacterium]|nr:PEP-CTERM sorting domain-containing protein [Bdellovibrionales bacterium]